MGVAPKGDTGVLATLQNAQTGNADGTPIDMKGVTQLTVHAIGAGFTGTINFEGTIDDTNWFSVGLEPIGTGAVVVSATASGAWKMPVRVPCLSQFRARTSGVSAGNVTVKARKDT